MVAAGVALVVDAGVAVKSGIGAGAGALVVAAAGVVVVVAGVVAGAPVPIEKLQAAIPRVPRTIAAAPM